jgi:hypothetical protein
MYLLYEINIKYNSYSQIVNNSTYMLARQMVLYLSERGEQDLSNELKITWIGSLVDE